MILANHKFMYFFPFDCLLHQCQHAGWHKNIATLAILSLKFVLILAIRYYSSCWYTFLQQRTDFYFIYHCISVSHQQRCNSSKLLFVIIRKWLAGGCACGAKEFFHSTNCHSFLSYIILYLIRKWLYLWLWWEIETNKHLWLLQSSFMCLVSLC